MCGGMCLINTQLCSNVYRNLIFLKMVMDSNSKRRGKFQGLVSHRNLYLKFNIDHQFVLVVNYSLICIETTYMACFLFFYFTLKLLEGFEPSYGLQQSCSKRVKRETCAQH